MSKLRFVQVNGYYDQLEDLPETRVSELPSNAFGRWMAQKRGKILALISACDQVSVLSANLPWFPQDVTKMQLDPDDSTVVLSAVDGPLWHVGKTDSDAARAHIWGLLGDASIFH
jgi:hypothetical protein